MSMEEDNQNEYLNSNIARWISNINKLEFLYVMKKRLLVIRQFCSSFGFYVYKIMWVKLIFIVKLFKIGGKKFYLGAILIFTASIIILNKNSFSTFQSNASNRLLSEKNISYSYESKFEMSYQRRLSNGFTVEFTKNWHIKKISKKSIFNLEEKCLLVPIDQKPWLDLIIKQNPIVDVTGESFMEQKPFSVHYERDFKRSEWAIIKYDGPYANKISSMANKISSMIVKMATNLVKTHDPSAFKKAHMVVRLNDDPFKHSPFPVESKEYPNRTRLDNIGNTQVYENHEQTSNPIRMLLDYADYFGFAEAEAPGHIAALIRYLREQPYMEPHWGNFSEVNQYEYASDSHETVILTVEQNYKVICLPPYFWNTLSSLERIWHLELPLKSSFQEKIEKIHVWNTLKGDCRSWGFTEIFWEFKLQLPLAPNDKQSIQFVETVNWKFGESRSLSFNVYYEFRF